MSEYKKNSLTLSGTVSMGTGVMIGAAIFALLGRINTLEGTSGSEIFYRSVEQVLIKDLVDKTIYKFNNINFKKHKN